MLIVIIEKKIITAADHQNIGRLYTTSLHQEKSSTAHALTDETRCFAVIDCFSAAVIGS